MMGRHGDGGLKSTVRSGGRRHTDTGVVAGVIVVVVIGGHERATTNAISTSIRPKATATATATAVHLVKQTPLLGLLRLFFAIVDSNMDTGPAHHGDGIVGFFRQIGDGECSHVILHRNEAKLPALARDAINYKSHLLHLSVRRKVGIKVRLADIVSQIRDEELPLNGRIRILMDEGWLVYLGGVHDDSWQ